jgi:hypothetical protein
MPGQFNRSCLLVISEVEEIQRCEGAKAKCCDLWHRVLINRGRIDRLVSR